MLKMVEIIDWSNTPSSTTLELWASCLTFLGPSFLIPQLGKEYPCIVKEQLDVSCSARRTINSYNAFGKHFGNIQFG